LYNDGHTIVNLQCDDCPDQGPELAVFLRSLGASDVLVGVGNPLRGDDGFGPELIARIIGKTRCRALDGGEMPEEQGAAILECKPQRILFADAVAFGGRPGDLVLLTPDELGKKVAISTHTLPLAMFIRELQQRLPGAAIRILGLQPRQIGLGKGLSPEVARTVQLLADLLVNNPI
jgi:hydrogenase 3 maturation protease